MSENRKQLAWGVVILAVLVVGSVLLGRLGSGRQPASEYAALPTPPYTIAKTALELYYASTPETVDSSPFPLTMTCELRRGGGEGVLAQQVFTWTVPCVGAYTSAPVVKPITLTWAFSEPLRVGWYEEWCKHEAAGVYGWLDGATSQQDNFFLVRNWEEVGLKCYLPLIMRGRK